MGHYLKTGLILMSYLQDCKLPIGQSGWVCENDMAVVGVFLPVFYRDRDIQQLINSHSNLQGTDRFIEKEKGGVKENKNASHSSSSVRFRQSNSLS